MLSRFYSLESRAKKLRKSGKSYGEIRSILNAKIPKSTLSYWCRNIKLPTNYQDRIDKIMTLGGKRGRLIAVEVNRVKRERYLKDISLKNKYLLIKLKNKDTAKIALAMLFWAEGSKSTRGSLMLGNSDPNMIRVFLRLLKCCYGIDRNRLTFRVQCRADQDIPTLEKFWQLTTGISSSMIRKASVDPRTIGKPSLKKEYKGVCRIDYYSAHIYNELTAICKLLGGV